MRVEEFNRYRQARHQETIRLKKETGKKVIGVFCCNVPEELIHAAGMLPVRILGEHEDTTEADLHLPTNVCPYPKRCFDQALKGRYNYLDGVVVPNVCDMIKAMYGFWKNSFNLPYVRFLEIPQRITEEGISFFSEELLRFKKSLEEFAGRTISEANLLHSIEVYNQNRALLRKVYELRRQSPPLISGVEAQEIVLSSMLMPKELHNQLLTQLLARVNSHPEALAKGARVLLSATMLDDTDFIALIEECGGSIVADDMPTGSRYFYYSVECGSDPYRGLAERYLAKIPCPRKMLPEARLNYVSQIIAETELKGAIIYNLKACDCHLYEYPYLKQKLEAAGLPTLFFRSEETATEREQQRNDIEAFLEVIQG